jgi:hypothetical protein
MAQSIIISVSDSSNQTLNAVNKYLSSRANILLGLEMPQPYNFELNHEYLPPIFRDIGILQQMRGRGFQFLFLDSDELFVENSALRIQRMLMAGVISKKGLDKERARLEDELSSEPISYERIFQKADQFRESITNSSQYGRASEMLLCQRAKAVKRRIVQHRPQIAVLSREVADKVRPVLKDYAFWSIS